MNQAEKYLKWKSSWGPMGQTNSGCGADSLPLTRSKVNLAEKETPWDH